VCSSNNYIEQQAYEMSEKIKKDSIYKFIKVVYSGGNDLGSPSGQVLITQVVLEDKDGTEYFVEPIPIGVKFAKGEISFKEYKKQLKRENLNGIASFFGIIVFFSGLMFMLMKYVA
jgi:hypothetical protein